MRFHQAANVTLRADDVVFRDSPTAKLFFALVMIAITIGIAVFAWKADDLVFKLMAGLCGLFALVVIRIYLRSLRSSNWLVRIRDRRHVFVKVRSYLNDHFDPHTNTVVEFMPGEIAWARELRRNQKTKDSRNRTQHEHQRYLELGLAASVDQKALREMIAAERRIKPLPNAAGVKTIVHHYPVALTDDGVLRIEWQSKSSWVRPALGKALEALASVCAVQETEKIVADYTPQALSEKQQAEQAILDLAASGRVIEAVQTARRLYGMSLRDAKTFVDGLISNPPPANPPVEIAQQDSADRQ